MNVGIKEREMIEELSNLQLSENEITTHGDIKQDYFNEIKRTYDTNTILYRAFHIAEMMEEYFGNYKNYKKEFLNYINK